MSKRNSISYPAVPQDEGSDMDVSSDDDGLNVTSLQPALDKIVSNMYKDDYRHHMHPSHLAHHGDPSASRVFPIAQQMDEIESDTESVNSFYTAPSSPMDTTMDDQEHNEQPVEEQPGLIEQLQKEHDKWTAELEYMDTERERITALIAEKNARLEDIRVKALELQVRKSIKRNRKAVIIPAKAKKIKEKGKGKAKAKTNRKAHAHAHAQAQAAYTSFSSSSEEQEDRPRKKPKAVAHPVTAQESSTRRGRIIKGILRHDSPFPSDVPDVPVPPQEAHARTAKHYLQTVKQSHVAGNTSIGQMKMFLCDLFDRFQEQDELTGPQRVHYKELVRKVAKFDEDGDDFIPTKGGSPSKKKKLTHPIVPKQMLMLPASYYGHPERLDFGNLHVDRIKLLDALNCSRVYDPKSVRKARVLLMKNVESLTVSDFQDVIDSHGNIIDREQLQGFIGHKKTIKLLQLYTGTLDSQFGNAYKKVEAKVETKSSSKRKRRRGVESTSPECSVEPSTMDAAVVMTPDVVNVAEQHGTEQYPLSNGRPIAVISYVPNETSFVRQVMPTPQPPRKKSILRRVTPTPLKGQAASHALESQPSSSISLKLTREPASLILYDNPPSSANMTPVSENQRAKVQAQAQVQAQVQVQAQAQAQTQAHSQYRSSSFQPYRSALNSLGVSQNSDVSIKKTGILCRAESNGGVCNDKHCPDVHFADFT